MPLQERVSIIGIGDDGLGGLSPDVRQLVEQADLLIGDERTLGLIPDGDAEQLVVGANPDEAVGRISAAARERIAVLVYGDPLFYGWARFLCEKLGKDRFEVVPHVSSMQLAFARLKESWDEAYLSDLANYPLEQVVDRIRTASKVGLFTSELNTPSVIAKALVGAGIDYFTAYVCENLGTPNERVTQGSLAEIAGRDFAPLNVMVLLRVPDSPDQPRDFANRRLFGNPEEAFLQSKPKEGLLTPAEVRAMALAQMDLGPTSIVWDVGAGSGSVSIEAAQVARDGRVYAIEMDPSDHALISENAKRFGVTQVTAVLGRAPEAWAELPDPDCIFVAGAGREITRIADQAFGRLKNGGRLVANVGSIANLSELHQSMSRSTSDLHVWMINIARGTHQLERVRFRALNPTFLLAAVK